MASELNQIASWSLRWRIGLAGALCLMAALCAAQPPDESVVLHAEQRFQLALEAQTARDYPSMLEQLRQAAAEDSAAAQEMLGMVLLGRVDALWLRSRGRPLRGPPVDASRRVAGQRYGQGPAHFPQQAASISGRQERLRLSPHSGGRDAWLPQRARGCFLGR
ncbi:sel1 repeat family protein [Variovorax paradoxus]|uniref:sel1 repeat family protein n=1 Tax=Variovorax paradoxus TaxID=34073 RepID=UPI002788192E|nr:sel1 repeat family protein [Variovorax paradoxus]MDQ0589676.1 hypothetical protein [Variovorax paradoxus]